MIRFTKALAAAATLLVVPSVASAVSIQIVNVTESGANDGILQPGETIMFDLRMTDNIGGAPIFGLGATVSGYDAPDVTGVYDNGIAHSGGTVVTEAFGLDHDANIATAPIGGRTNTIAPNSVEDWEVNQFNPNAYVTTLFQGVDTNAAIGDGTDDVGLGGGLVHGGGDIHFQVTFANVAAGRGQGFVAPTTLDFVVEVVTTGGASSTTSTPFNLTVVPEPGTALLMGLGLAGLATTRRR